MRFSMDNFFKDFKKPYNLISLLITLVALVLSFYFYQKSLRTKELTIFSSKTDAKVFDSNKSLSKIKILVDSALYGKKDIWLKTIVVKNTGDLSISNSDIRKNITLKLDDSSNILDYKITKCSFPEIFKIKDSLISDHELIISWQFFDTDFELGYQILYGNNKMSELELEGYIQGIKTFNSEIFLNETEVKKKRSFLYLSAILALTSSVCLFVLIILRKDATKRVALQANELKH